MTQVDFYILTGGTSRPERDRFACRLTEKAWQKGYRVFIHTGSDFEAQQLDDLLWTFRPESFVPHALATDPNSAALPVLVGWGSEPTRALDLLINLSGTVPAYFQRFARLAEIVESDDTQRDIARRRYRHYRDQGCSLRSHRL